MGEVGFSNFISDAFSLDAYPCLLLVCSTTGQEMARICGRVNPKKIEDFLKKPVMVKVHLSLPDGSSTSGEFGEDYRVQVLLAACQKIAHGEAITLLFADDSGTTRCINEQSTGKIKEYNLNKSK